MLCRCEDSGNEEEVAKERRCNAINRLDEPDPPFKEIFICSPA